MRILIMPGYFLMILASFVGLVPSGNARFWPIRPGDVMLPLMAYLGAFWLNVVAAIVIAYLGRPVFDFVLVVGPVSFLVVGVTCRIWLEIVLQKAIPRLDDKSLKQYHKEMEKERSAS